jgi:putative RecB family exonuclease
MPIYSHSRLQAFENCPLQYKFSYIDKKERGKEGIEAFVGSMVHETLEKLYKDVKMGRMPSVEELLAFYNKRWKEDWNAKIVIVNENYTEENYRNVGETCIRNFYSENKPFRKGVIMGLEMPIQIKLDPHGKYVMRGYIDRLMFRGKGVYEIHDYKTSTRMMSKEEADQDRQLALYSMPIYDMYDDAKEVVLVYHYLRFKKTVHTARTREQLEKLKNELIGLIQSVERTSDFLPNRSKLCNWCAFKEDCPEWKHILKVEELPKNRFLEDPGVKLVDKYQELAEQLKKLEGEQSDVREALIHFARKNEMSLIDGSSRMAKVTLASSLKLPAKGDEKREELESLLKEMNKWGQVSTLDTFALCEIIKSKKWDEEHLEKLKRFWKEEESARVSLVKK